MNTSSQIVFQVSDGTDASTAITSTATIADSNWGLIIAKHDSANNLLSLKINNNTTETQAWANGVLDSALFPFKIGTRPSSLGNTAATFDGKIDECVFFKNYVTTDADDATLYNGGVGIAWPF